MVAFPPCKINLGLRVLRRRPDGYHDIETGFYPIPWTDVLEIIPSDAFSFSQTGIQIDGEAASNLCVQAYRTLERDYVVPPVIIHLHKCIPTGAGLGGGSADAAFVMRMISEIADLNLQQKTIMQMASELGSDCSFFVQDGPMIGSGKGDMLSAVHLDLSGTFLIVVKPNIAISTGKAYTLVQPNPSIQPIKEILEGYPMETWQGKLINDFEEPVFRQFPRLQEIKEQLYAQGASYAAMSGSGSAIYGIFEKPTRFICGKDELTWSCLL